MSAEAEGQNPKDWFSYKMQHLGEMVLNMFYMLWGGFLSNNHCMSDKLMSFSVF